MAFDYASAITTIAGGAVSLFAAGGLGTMLFRRVASKDRVEAAANESVSKAVEEWRKIAIEARDRGLEDRKMLEEERKLRRLADERADALQSKISELEKQIHDLRNELHRALGRGAGTLT